MFRFVRAIEELTKALNRLMNLWEALQQKEVDEFAATLLRANQRSKQAIDRMQEAITNNQ